MASFLPLLFLVADPVASLDAFLSSQKCIVAVTDFSISGRTLGRATLKIERPSRLRFDLQSKTVDYTLSSTEAGYCEIDRKAKIYDEHVPVPNLIVLESRITNVTGWMPKFLTATSSRQLFGNQKPMVTKVAQGHELKATVEGPMGSTTYRITINPQGKPLSFRVQGERGEQVWTVLSLKAGQPGLANHMVKPPLGFVPHAIPIMPMPLEIGETAPLSGWTQNGKTVNLGLVQSGKPRLLAVLAPDCLPSQKARTSLKRLAANLPVFIIGPGEITDPDGTRLKRLSAPGTPMFYLVDGKGVVKRLWFGYDPAKAAEFETQILEKSREN